jgi:thiol-disulfide isomerase/thioredoxin
LKLTQDSSLALIHSKIEAMKQSELAKFRELLDNREISESFFNLVKADRDCYYASLESASLFKMYRIVETKQFVLPNGENLLENLTKICTQYPPDDKRLTVSPFWPEYAEFYVKKYKQVIREDFDREKERELYRQGIVNTFWMDESKKYLTGKSLEFFQATLIYFAGFRKNHEKELITLFEQFMKDYPDNGYSKYIKPEIDQIVQYHQIIEKPFDETVHFVDGYENITTLEDAIRPFRGRKIYIDIWATWCKPCKREFAHQQALKKILDEQDIQSLYISIDENDRDQQWKEAIKFYGLSGAHIRASRPLFEELCERYNKKDKYVNIPWYILVDENGKILKKHAEAPSKIVGH